jgi:hypothetical protein
MAQKQYKSYMAMKCKLQRSSKLNSSLKHYAALTTALFDTFLKNNGYLSSKDYYGSKFEVAGKKYSDWIHELKEARVLIQYKSDGNKGADFIRFSAGPLIVDYINAEKVKTREIALADDVPSKAEFEALKTEAAELKSDSQEMKARMNKIEETVSELKSAMEPPDTQDKQKRRKMAADKLTQLALVKSN